jgi:hypothetical protein
MRSFHLGRLADVDVVAAVAEAVNEPQGRVWATHGPNWREWPTVGVGSGRLGLWHGAGGRDPAAKSRGSAICRCKRLVTPVHGK